MRLLNQKCLGLKDRVFTQQKSNLMKNKNHKKEKYLKLHPQLAVPIVEDIPPMKAKESYKIMEALELNSGRTYFNYGNSERLRTANNKYSLYTNTDAAYFTIISVKRLSDNKIFRVGDSVTCTGGFHGGRIHSFEPRNSYPPDGSKYLIATITSINPLRDSQKPNISCLSHANS